MAQPATNGNVLTKLDDRVPTAFYWQLTLLATLGGFLFGYDTWHASVLLIARTLIGLAIGADSAITTAYIAEYAPKNRRGSLTMLQQWMITVGILVAYIVALIIFALWPASAASSGWRLVLGLGAVPALIGLVMRSRMPESPRWLLRQAAAFCAMIDWLANFLIIEVFPVSQNAIGLDGVLVIFAGLCALAIVFVWKFLPETKELPVEEIVRVFEKQQKNSVLHRWPEPERHGA
jgi:MFS family permease